MADFDFESNVEDGDGDEIETAEGAYTIVPTIHGVESNLDTESDKQLVRQQTRDNEVTEHSQIVLLDGPSRPSSGNLLKRRPCKRRSVVWKVFEADHGEGVAVCQLCGVKLTFWSSTSALLKHFIALHPDEYAHYAADMDDLAPPIPAIKGNPPEPVTRSRGRPKGSKNVKRPRVEEDSNGFEELDLETEESFDESRTMINASGSKCDKDVSKKTIPNVVERVTPLIGTFDIADDSFDVVLVVTSDVGYLTGSLSCLHDVILKYSQIDKSYNENTVVLYTDKLPGHRLVYSCTREVGNDCGDVRVYRDAAIAALNRATEAGCKRPLLICPNDDRYRTASYVATLGVLQAIYAPLRDDETYREGERQTEMLGLWCENEATPERTLVHMSAIECARIITRDISVCSSEQMTPSFTATWLSRMFSNTTIKVKVITDPMAIGSGYPLFSAIGKGKSSATHDHRIVLLEYTSTTSNSTDQTLFLVGQGSSICDQRIVDGDSGDAPWGRSGAAAVAGFFQMLHMTKPRGLKVVGGLMLAHNYLGSGSLSRGDVITSREGLRIRVGNTVVDGPLVMADMLCRFREMAQSETNPQIISIGSRSDTKVTTFSPEYTMAIGNGPAQQKGCSIKLKQAGSVMGDVVQMDFLHKQHYEACKGMSHYVDLLHAPPHHNHVTDVAFMILASGLSQYGVDSDHPLPYTHLNVDLSAGAYPNLPTGAPIPALAHTFIIPRLR